MKARMSENSDGVAINFNLPPEVRTVFIYQYGQSHPICYFRKFGKKSYDASRLEEHPFEI